MSGSPPSRSVQFVSLTFAGQSNVDRLPVAISATTFGVSTRFVTWWPAWSTML